MKYSICTEIICPGIPLCEAIEKLHALGISTIEFWGWANKDLKQAKTLLNRYDMNIATFCVDSTNPKIAGELARFILTGGYKEDFLTALQESTAVAKEMGTNQLIITTGLKVDGLSYEQQMANIRDCLMYVKDYLEENQITLLLEPINLSERPLFIEPHAAPTIDTLKSINSPYIKLLYDMYHQALTGDLCGKYITENIAHIGHFHIADAPDRHEPGTGTTNFAAIFDGIRQTTYDGYIGLECRPLGALSEIFDAINKL